MKPTEKELNSQLRRVQEEIAGLKSQVANLQREISVKEKIAIHLKKDLVNYQKPKEITVSEHALLRYLERVQGIDMEKIKRLIISDQVIKLVDKLGPSGHFPNNGFHVVMKDNKVITIEKGKTNG